MLFMNSSLLPGNDTPRCRPSGSWNVIAPVLGIPSDPMTTTRPAPSFSAAAPAYNGPGASPLSGSNATRCSSTPARSVSAQVLGACGASGTGSNGVAFTPFASCTFTGTAYTSTPVNDFNG